MKKKLLTAIFASSLLLAACGNDETAATKNTEVQETATEESKATEDTSASSEVGTRSNPYSVGETAEFKVVYYDDAGEPIDGLLNFTINEVISGDEANEFIMSENEFNEPAPEGYQFVLLDSTATLVEGSEDIQYDLLLTQEIFDSSGQSVVLDEVYATTGNRLSDQSIFPGATAEGYIIPVVPEEIDGTLMKMQSLGGGDSVWFKLN